MKWLRTLLAAERKANLEQAGVLRGKVSRNSVIKGGELSVVVRFGIEEADRVRDLLPGALVSVALEEQSDER